MGVLAAATLRRQGVGSLAIVNRTLDRAERIAATHDGTAHRLDELPALLADADVVVTAAGARVPLIEVVTVAQARAGAAHPVAFVDLALPADTAPGIAGLPGVTRVDLGTLHDLPAAHASAADLEAAHGIVRDEVEALLAAQAARIVEPTLVALREHAADVVAAEIDRLRLRLSGLPPEEFAEVERALRRAVGALLHTPSVRIKEYAVGPEGTAYAEALRALFDLDPSVVDAVGGGPAT
jgi:glutamyl-tRNA reductase